MGIEAHNIYPWVIESRIDENDALDEFETDVPKACGAGCVEGDIHYMDFGCCELVPRRASVTISATIIGA